MRMGIFWSSVVSHLTLLESQSVIWHSGWCIQVIQKHHTLSVGPLKGLYRIYTLATTMQLYFRLSWLNLHNKTSSTHPSMLNQHLYLTQPKSAMFICCIMKPLYPPSDWCDLNCSLNGFYAEHLTAPQVVGTYSVYPESETTLLAVGAPDYSLYMAIHKIEAVKKKT